MRRMTMSKIIPLDQKKDHTRIFLSLLLRSHLDYGCGEDMETDPRVLAWKGGGTWAVATTGDDGKVAGIACVVRLSDVDDKDALLWLEVLPEHQRQGHGSALLEWATQIANGPMLIESTEGARGFYRQHGLAA